MTTDPYALSAEFYDVMAAAHWAALGPVVSGALAGADPTGGPILDIGAGTGLSTVVIAAAHPQASIVAVEPSAAMRAALTSRILGTPHLAERVTVLAVAAEEAELPERISAVVACGVVGYLDPAGRPAFWKLLADRLAPEAPVVVDVMPIPAPMEVPTMLIARARLGDHSYEVWISGVPDGDAERWTMTYRVRREDVILREFRTDHTWHVFDLDRLAAEAEVAGFGFEKLTDHAAVLIRR